MVTDKDRNEIYKIIGIVTAFVLLTGTAGCALLPAEESVYTVEGGRILSMEELERRASPESSSPKEGTGAALGDTAPDNAVPSGAVSDGDEENDSFLYEGGSEYACGLLTESEKIWYREIAEALGVMADKIKLSEEGIREGLDERFVDKIFQSVMNDHPELFFVEGYSYTTYTRDGQTVAIEFMGTYSQKPDTAQKRRDRIEQAVADYLAQAPDTQDDYEKIKYVYERLIRDTDYDVGSEENQNIYSVFVGKASVCQGYAKAFQYLMNRLGVECTLVQGKVIGTGEGHAWNLVRSNGEYYYVDTTWGDISYKSEETLPRISYDYLCITTEQMERTHTLNEDMQMPCCTAVADNYFVREDALFENYDREKMAALVKRKLDRGEDLIAIRCRTRECYDTMSEALLTGQEIFDYLEDTGIHSFAYTADEIQQTVTFFLMTSEG